MRCNRLATVLAGALVLSGGAALAEGPVLDIQKTGLGPGLPYTMTWGVDPAVPAFAVYDVNQGDLAVLMTPPAGDYTVAMTVCLLEDGPLPPPVLALPAPVLGGENFYLVRAQAAALVCGGASWNEAFAVAPFSQVGDRDIEIPVDPMSCPCP